MVLKNGAQPLDTGEVINSLWFSFRASILLLVWDPLLILLSLKAVVIPATKVSCVQSALKDIPEAHASSVRFVLL